MRQQPTTNHHKATVRNTTNTLTVGSHGLSAINSVTIFKTNQALFPYVLGLSACTTTANNDEGALLGTTTQNSYATTSVTTQLTKYVKGFIKRFNKTGRLNNFRKGSSSCNPIS